MPFDPQLQRRILGHFATGVTIITTGAGAEGGEWGMTANSIASLSLDPPLILFGIDLRNEMRTQLAAHGCFAVNLLRVDQEHLSQRFAAPGPKDFSGIDVRYEQTGAPILGQSLGHVDCRITAIHPGGDHEIVIGEIVSGAMGSGEPLLFYSGHYRHLAEPSPSEAAGGDDSAYTLEESYRHFGAF